MLKCRQTTIAALALTLLSGCSHPASTAPLHIASDIPYPPYEWTTPEGKYTGFEVDLVNAVCQRMHRTCEWQTQPFDGIIPGLLANKYDIIASSMIENDARDKVVAFSHPYFNAPSTFIENKQHPIALDNNASLQGVTIGVQQGSAQDDYVTQRYPNAIIKRYQRLDDIVIDMDAGRLNLAMISFAAAQSTLLKEAQYQVDGPAISEPVSIFGKGCAAAFRKSDTALVNQFNQALQKIIDDGTYMKLMHKYVSYDIRPHTADFAQSQGQ